VHLLIGGELNHVATLAERDHDLVITQLLGIEHQRSACFIVSHEIPLSQNALAALERVDLRDESRRFDMRHPGRARP
jgi:hypothetical protein